MSYYGQVQSRREEKGCLYLWFHVGVVLLFMLPRKCLLLFLTHKLIISIADYVVQTFHRYCQTYVQSRYMCNPPKTMYCWIIRYAYDTIFEESDQNRY
ncbi:hypothetical protein RND71_036557 [Anisodus tanguticus]|uniref:Uncharacterized protein n=1 Tax=Anisodus tanguticus TaxID=243964 RepID=A0AAE1USV2_9SOLA|nr:hypothetical protein RND71_036557 [Anisodus tanguticus]